MTGLGIVFAEQIGERLVQERLDGAVGVRREVLNAAMILGLDDKRQAPLPGPRRGKVPFRRWSGLLGLNLWKGLGFKGLHAIGKTWSFLGSHRAARPHCQQGALLSKEQLLFVWIVLRDGENGKMEIPRLPSNPRRNETPAPSL